jgi:polysaccharide export outer membrane protein
MKKVIFCIIIIALAGCGARITTPIVTSQGKGDRGRSNPGVVHQTAQGAERNQAEISARSGAVKDEYRMGPGDILHVSVWNNEELTLDVMVRPDGKISLPLIQDVTAAGLTAEELRSIIEVRLKEYLIEPVVTATVKEVNYPKFFIMGEISKPGTYPLRERLTVLQAISLAGGFTQFATPRNIRLIRNNGSTRENIRINYYELIRSGDQDKNLFLVPGDTVIVP